LPPDAEFTDSMAEAMENALAAEWLRLRNRPLPALGREDRRLLFVAIAQGVVRHLRDNAEAALRVHSVEVRQEDTLVQSTGTFTGFINVQVEQESAAGMPGTPATPVVSRGEGKLEVLTTGILHP
jgi:hypothetical protein